MLLTSRLEEVNKKCFSFALEPSKHCNCDQRIMGAMLRLLKAIPPAHVHKGLKTFNYGAGGTLNEVWR